MMTTNKITESAIEELAIELLEKQGYQYVYAPDMAPDSDTPERTSFDEVLLLERLRKAVGRINPSIPADAREDAIKQILRLNSPELIANNEAFHRMLTEGIKVSYQKDGADRGDLVWLIDLKNPENNEFLVSNQFTVIENEENKRPDVILFVNGLPLVVIELKNPADENATAKSAFKQLQTYKQAIPGLFSYNGFMVISDGLEAKAGSLSAGFSRFMAWKSSDGKTVASARIGQMETLIKGMLNKRTLLDLIRHFIVFDKSAKLTPSLNPSQREGGHYRGGMDFTGMIKRVRDLRKNQTEAEIIFWELVRNKKLLGLKFRRQHQIGHYIVDFYCHSERLIIELDGEVHNTPEQKKKDGIRVKYLKSLGNRILRFNNAELFENTENVLKTIEKSLSCKKEGFSPIGRDGREGGITTVTTIKKLAAYHQYYAVNKAVESTLRASGYLVNKNGTFHDLKVTERPESYGLTSVDTQPAGDRKGGVVWHTQGSGKSLSMVFFTGKIVLVMDNPTILVITDRNDLDDQLFDTFAASKQLLRQDPVQAESRGHLKELLNVASGGVVFTTIQKFQPEEGNVYPMLSDRRNIIVIADEAHRTQYGFKAKTIDAKDEQGNVIGKKIVYGFAKYTRDALPNATYLGFTGTPIEKTDVNTPAVFGNYVDVYGIAQAVEDGATVKIYYESRLAKITLSEAGKKLVAELDEELEKEDLAETQKAKAKWTQLEALIGSEDRIRQVAQDIVTHFEQRQEVFEGKGMIVAMSRRIAANLYDKIIKIKPGWHNDDLKKGVIKVVMTSASSDGPEISKHHTTKEQRRYLAERMKDTEDELKLVIVRDMWLTGFDVPSLHTMYIDKPMKGHTLMQAIARVNRVYKDKPGGLVVDYLGIASDLKEALSFYSDSGGKGDPAVLQEKAVQLMHEKREIVSQMFHGFPYKHYFAADTSTKLSLILATQEHILGLENGKKRYIDEVTALSGAFAIAIPHEQAMAVKDEVSFYQAIKARLVKFDSTGTGKTDEEIETAIR